MKKQAIFYLNTKLYLLQFPIIRLFKNPGNSILLENLQINKKIILEQTRSLELKKYLKYLKKTIYA